MFSLLDYHCISLTHCQLCCGVLQIVWIFGIGGISVPKPELIMES